MKKLTITLFILFSLVLYGCEQKPKDFIFELNQDEVTLTINETHNIVVETNRVGDLVFESDEPEVAQVDSNGIVTALKVGSTNIAVMIEGIEYGNLLVTISDLLRRSQNLMINLLILYLAMRIRSRLKKAI